jgi:hypothetical protein
MSDSESHIFSPGLRGYLHADGQAIGGRADSNYHGRPTGEIVDHRITESGEEIFIESCAMRQRRKRQYWRQ